MKIALGTVQFGLNYGISNKTGRLLFEDVKNILQVAKTNGIDTLDTAILYGDSESTLGRAGVLSWKVLTKLPALPAVCEDIEGWVESQIEGSLIRMGINQLHGVLLHRPNQLFENTGHKLLKALEKLKTKGFAKKVGISVYSPDELVRLTQDIDLDLVQAPLNILDRRLIDSGWAMQLKSRGVEVHVRSAFLQGLLLMSAEQRPVKFSRWNPIWTEWTRWLDENGLTPLQACLGYILDIQEVDKVVVGVDSVGQLNEILGSTGYVLPNLPNWQQQIDPTLINPSQWSQL